jgi:uncharacterized small protein (DUF1192 family)
VSSKAVVPQAAGVSAPPGGRTGSPTGLSIKEMTELADLFGSLDSEVQRFKPTAKKHEAARKAIQALYDAAPADQEFVMEGHDWQIQIGPREKQRTILSMAKLVKAITIKAFLEHCTFPLKIIDALLPGDKQKNLVAESRSGTRPVKAVSSEILKAA